MTLKYYIVSLCLGGIGSYLLYLTITVPLMVFEYGIKNKIKQIKKDKVEDTPKPTVQQSKFECALNIALLCIYWFFTTYFAAYASWTLLYFIRSFSEPASALPWENCAGKVNTTVTQMCENVGVQIFYFWDDILGGRMVETWNTPVLGCLAVTWTAICLIISTDRKPYFVIRRGIWVRFILYYSTQTCPSNAAFIKNS